MDLLIPFVLKSFLLAGAALLLLRLFRHRSAAARSVIAHLALLALVLVPTASLILPPLHIGVPAAAAGTSGTATSVALYRSIVPATMTTAKPMPTTAIASETAENAVEWAVLGYALPAIGLLFVILLALGRLFSLRARADVLVEPIWLHALAHAQHRMGFKHGTALLIGDELPSPISWGLVRPVILLNQEALRSHHHAEAIIAHELAHVARLDWAKLLLARVTTAFYWFNPLVWMLAREAHQLREETADDAVLAANITETDYAQLLVGAARHRCNGLLLTAHGVAPSRKSLARRVRRVLDATSVRGPVARSFAAGAAVSILAVATPLAALSFDADPALSAKMTASGGLGQAGVGLRKSHIAPAAAQDLAPAPRPLVANTDAEYGAVQPPASVAPYLPATGNSLLPDEAARRALELCFDHALGTALIGPAAAQQLENNGFRLTSDPATPPALRQFEGPSYTIRTSITQGSMRIEAYTGGLCIVRLAGGPIAEIEEVFRTLLAKPGTSFAPVPSYKYPLGDVALKWRWRRPGQDLHAYLHIARNSGPGLMSMELSPVVNEPDPD